MAKQGATLAMPTISSSVNQLCCLAPPRLPSQGGVVVKGYFSKSPVMQYAPKIAWRRSGRPRAALRRRNSQIANESLGPSRRRRSRNESIRLSDISYDPDCKKTGFPKRNRNPDFCIKIGSNCNVGIIGCFLSPRSPDKNQIIVILKRINGTGHTDPSEFCATSL